MKTKLAMLVALLSVALATPGVGSQEAVRMEPNPPPTPFDYGGFAAEDPWLSDLTNGREAHGLKSDKALVIELMTSPDAQRQVATYGVVLTGAEEAEFEARAAAHSDAQKMIAVAEDLPSYAGSMIQDDHAPYGLTVWVGGGGAEADLARLEEVQRNLKGNIAINVEVREFSISDLMSLGSSLMNITESQERPRFDDAQIAVATKAIQALGLPAETVFGYSMRNGTLLAQLPEGVEWEQETVDLGEGLPAMDISTTADSGEDAGPEDQGYAACGRYWCGAPKGGHITRFQAGSSYYVCSWAGTIQVRETSSSGWLYRQVTAGHCGDTNRNEQFFNYANQGSSLTPSTHFGIVRSTTPENTVGVEWRNSTEETGAAWGDFSLVTTSEPKASNLVMTGNTTTARVTSLMGTTVDLDICISARSTGVKCDEVEDIGRTRTTDGKYVTHLASVRGSYDAEGGDSGATIYVEGSPHQLAGVHHGWYRNIYFQKFQLFSRITLIDNSPNMGIYQIRPVLTDGRRDFIAGLYTRNLNRLPDTSGFDFWENEMSPCSASTASYAGRSFLNSVEFTDRFPITSGNYSTKKKNAELRVWYAYRTFFGRDPDSNGLDFWLETWMMDMGIDVGQGESQWLSAIAFFGSSPEFVDERVPGPTALADGPICA